MKHKRGESEKVQIVKGGSLTNCNFEMGDFTLEMVSI